ncbi:hypothetical protein ACKI1I_02790 [Streptomyces turgidiscabies]|uniref:Uncharacterized protein n=1 Tax=Streptomyces turgidiscabies (strain Car8) TaxID=698760 RepID=L7ET27_STRT8|nr:MULTISPECIES: hypothetical protein [Streptomyces]ELP61871.1 hypothetical protein STRTUCAR8_05514 [Streptomyces turgidiscabies Car8]MDX3492175.1 hypothetical protein [Streptomyces turgidiscabies]GAQ69534.1 hypothetical protein T45_01260 [Streptomyces turgidiscabies]
MESDAENQVGKVIATSLQAVTGSTTTTQIGRVDDPGSTQVALQSVSNGNEQLRRRDVNDALLGEPFSLVMWVSPAPENTADAHLYLCTKSDHNFVCLDSLDI